jgi:hypothetical protein
VLCATTGSCVLYLPRLVDYGTPVDERLDQ